MSWITNLYTQKPQTLPIPTPPEQIQEKEPHEPTVSSVPVLPPLEGKKEEVSQLLLVQEEIQNKTVQNLETISSSLPEEAKETTVKIRALFEMAKETFVSTKNKIYNSLSSASVEFTKTKLIQGIIVATSAYFLLGAKAIFGGFFPKTFATFLGASPFVAASGALLLWANSFIDYEGEKSLSYLREQAKNQDILTLKREHGLPRVIIHGLLTEEQFEKKCAIYMSTLSIKNMIAFYKEVNSAITRAKLSLENCAYVAPHPSRFKDSFENEVKGLPLQLYSENYSLDELEKFGFLDKASLDALVEIKQLSNEKVKETDALQNEINAIEEEISSLKKIHARKILLEDLRQAINEGLLSIQDEGKYIARAREIDSSFEETIVGILAKQRKSQEEIQQKLDSALSRFQFKRANCPT